MENMKSFLRSTAAAGVFTGLLLASSASAAARAGYADAFGAAAHASSVGPVYLVIDGAFYQVDTATPPAMTYEPVGSGDYAWVSPPAILNGCATTSQYPAGNLFLIYGYTDPALPIIRATYEFLLNQYGSASLLIVETAPGNVSCQYEVPPPAVVEEIFRNGFEGP
jgi:hypothetical protein